MFDPPVSAVLAAVTSQDTGPTALDIVTLVAAIIGVVLSVAALVWQMVTFRFTGPVVELIAQRGIIIPSGERTMSATARNTGRAPVQVSSWGFCHLTQRRPRTLFRRKRRGSFLYVTTGIPGLAHPPVTVDGGHDVTFQVELDTLLSQFKESPPPERTATHAWVALATGKSVYSRKPIDLADCEPSSAGS